jgi:hypothetical protein
MSIRNEAGYKKAVAQNADGFYFDLMVIILLNQPGS